jgi:hypothetical protein
MLWQFPVEDGLVVARRDLRGLFLLNATARFMWDEFHRGATPAEIVQNVVSRYGVAHSLANQDVEITLAGWLQGPLSPEARERRQPGAMGDPVVGSLSATDCVLNGRGFRVLLEPGDLVEEIGPRLTQIAVTCLPADSPVITFSLVNGEDQVFVFRDSVCIAEEEKTSGARAILLQEMTSLCAPDREPKAILHAGACGTAAGCVILAGASHAGKSTLCAALMADGLFCYSDDSAILDGNFEIAGMPFPVMLRESSWAVLEAHSPSLLEGVRTRRRLGCDVRFLPSNLPANSSPVATPKALVFVEFKAQERLELRPVAPLEALLALRQGGFWVAHDERSIAGFLAWVDRLDCYKLTYSRIGDASDAVRGLLAER